jgi:hypothetical protein
MVVRQIGIGVAPHLFGSNQHSSDRKLGRMGEQEITMKSQIGAELKTILAR